MSRSSGSTQVRVHLAGDALNACVVQRDKRGWRVVDKARFAFFPGERSAAFGVFAAWMRPAASNASVAWIFGSADVKYVLLPWAPELVDDRLRDAVANALFIQLFGQDPVLCEVRFAPLSYGCTRWAAFVMRGLLAEVDAHAREAHRRLAAIEPAVSAVWQRFAPLLGKERGVLGVIDGDRQTLVRHDLSRIESIAFRPFGGEEGRAIHRPHPTGETLRFFCSTPLQSQSQSQSTSTHSTLSLPAVPGFDPTLDGAYVFALCGVL